MRLSSTLLLALLPIGLAAPLRGRHHKTPTPPGTSDTYPYQANPPAPVIPLTDPTYPNPANTAAPAPSATNTKLGDPAPPVNSATNSYPANPSAPATPATPTTIPKPANPYSKNPAAPSAAPSSVPVSGGGSSANSNPDASSPLGGTPLGSLTNTGGVSGLVGTVTGLTGTVTGALGGVAGGGLPVGRVVKARDVNTLPASLFKRMEDLAVDIRAEMATRTSMEERQLPVPLPDTPLSDVLSQDRLGKLDAANPTKAVGSLPFSQLKTLDGGEAIFSQLGLTGLLRRDVDGADTSLDADRLIAV